VGTQITGNVKDVSCDGKEMKITAAVRDMDFHLHVRNYSRISFDEGTPFQTGNFDPCAQLLGQVVEVTFIMVENKSYDGEIQSVEMKR
jgi:hypothetical protein